VVKHLFCYDRSSVSHENNQRRSEDMLSAGIVKSDYFSSGRKVLAKASPADIVAAPSPLWLEGIRDADMLEETLQNHAREVLSR
jgi:hypothetical protein